jgi:hypothetical protein
VAVTVVPTTPSLRVSVNDPGAKPPDAGAPRARTADVAMSAANVKVVTCLRMDPLPVLE